MLLKSTENQCDSGSYNCTILSLKTYSFKLILLSVLRRMPRQEGSSALLSWIVGGGERLNSTLLLWSLLSEDTEGRDCLKNILKQN